ncbi:hypothetical protein H4R34_002640 [Dimargaris verticillata]|uniref:BD-FAE-like domain-containing protein n=1 Tax=Dimargaris verticillata TaxID=2761393 RepID=A0A9W8EDW8_9FUNG|nr:hypothetical protein H4R34_002640 [Dimargaris verticillata]
MSARMIEVHKDLIYYHGPQGADPRHRLDLYLPSSAGQTAQPPLLVLVHGGMWYSGDKRELAWLGQRLATDYGLAVALVNYRLSSVDTNLFPVPALDVSRALAFLVTYAAQLGYDGSRLLLGGHSVGAQMVALIALQPSRYFYPAVQDMIGPVTCAQQQGLPWVQGVIGIAGLYHLPRLLQTFPSYHSYYVRAFQDQPELWERCSPELVVLSPNHPRVPWLVLHSSEDELVDVSQAHGMVAYLKAAAFPVHSHYSLAGTHDGLLETMPLVHAIGLFIQSMCT